MLAVLRLFWILSAADKPSGAFHHGWPVVDERWGVETPAVLAYTLAATVQSLATSQAFELVRNGAVVRSKSVDTTVFVDQEQAYQTLVSLNGDTSLSTLSHLTDILLSAAVRVQLVPDVATACQGMKYASEVKPTTLRKQTPRLSHFFRPIFVCALLFLFSQLFIWSHQIL